jgi:hypothetical protein
MTCNLLPDFNTVSVGARGRGWDPAALWGGRRDAP